MNDSDLVAILAHARERHGIPGLAAAVVRDGGIIACAANGIASLAGARAARIDQPSRWYSISKGLTVVVVLDLVHRGRLDLDAPLRSLIPGLRFASDDATSHASLRDCLLHRTGLTAGNWIWDGASPDPEALVANLAGFPCATRTGDGYAYQNLHFTLIERALAAIGVDWRQAIAELAQRLGIRLITGHQEFIAADRFAPHGPHGLMPAQPIADVDVSGVIAGAGICGSIRDLAAVAGMVAGNGAWQGVEILPRGWWDLAIAPLARGDDHGPGSERRERRGAMAGAWSTYRGQRLLAWAGGFRGHTSHLLAIPALGIAACALGNRSDSPGPDAVCLELLDRALGWPEVDWPERYRREKAALLGAGAERLAARLALPVAAEVAMTGVSGTFRHPAYGTLEIAGDADARRLRFRWLELPLLPRDDGRWTVDGLAEGNAVHWDLRPELVAGRVEAWHFNPDHGALPLRFAATGTPAQA